MPGYLGNGPLLLYYNKKSRDQMKKTVIKETRDVIWIHSTCEEGSRNYLGGVCAVKDEITTEQN